MLRWIYKIFMLLKFVTRRSSSCMWKHDNLQIENHHSIKKNVKFNEFLCLQQSSWLLCLELSLLDDDLCYIISRFLKEIQFWHLNVLSLCNFNSEGSKQFHCLLLFSTVGWTKVDPNDRAKKEKLGIEK